MHQDLDSVERRLAKIRLKQQRLQELPDEPKPTESAGTVTTLDLRDIVELVGIDDDDEDFDRRFGEFTAHGPDERSRRWLEQA